MPQAREENMKDIGMQVFQIGIDSFFERVLPSVDDMDLSLVLTRLRTGGTLDQQTGEWLHFKNKGQPQSQQAHESVVFEPIQDLAKDIISACTKEAHFVYDSRPASVPESSESHNSSRPDGYFVLKIMADDLEIMDAPGKPEKPWWRNLTLISEFKKAEGSRARNDVRGLLVRASRSEHL